MQLQSVHSMAEKDTPLTWKEVEVAYLYHSGKSQAQIQKAIGNISQSTVSRLIQSAIDKGLLVQREPEFLRELLPEEISGKLESTYGEVSNIPQLHKLSENFTSLRVMPKRSFHEDAAKLIPKLLEDVKVLGISWGRTCRMLVEALRPTRKLKNLQCCIPIQGDPFFCQHRNASKYATTRLAILLEDQLMPRKSEKERRKNRSSLIGVPAYVSGKYKGVIDKFYSDLFGYQKIFGPDGLARQLDGIICGVGVFDDSDSDLTGVFIKERIAQGDISEEELREICTADFGGILLPKGEPSERIDELNEGFVGMDLEMLKCIADKARSGKKPGSIVIAQGKRKAEAVIAAIRTGLVSQLIVDAPLAREMKKLLKE